jgi:hypothetical protein
VRPIEASKTALLSHLYINAIILPRQARDKHRENTQKRVAFSSSGAVVEAGSLDDFFGHAQHDSSLPRVPAPANIISVHVKRG